MPHLVGIPSKAEKQPDKRRPKLLFLDPRHVTRDAITLWLRRVQRLFDVVPFHPDRARSRGELRLSEFDLVVLSVDNDEADRPEWLQPMLRKLRGVPTVLLASEEHSELVANAASCGARGVVTLSMDKHVFVQVLRLVHMGGTSFPASLLARSIKQVHEAADLCSGDDLPQSRGRVEDESPPTVPPPPAPALHGLTPREHDVFQFLSQGHCNKRIARGLSISQNTVKIHVRRIKAKLGAESRLEMALMAR